MEAEGYLVQSGQFTGMKGGKHSEAVDAIIDWLGEQGLGRKNGAVSVCATGLLAVSVTGETPFL